MNRTVIALVALAMASCAAPDPLVGATVGPEVADIALLPPPPDRFAATVTRISDGDTLWIEVAETAVDGIEPGDELKVRLLRIDAPERARDGQPAECGADEATVHLQRLTPIGSRVLAAYDVERQDRFGRELLHLWNEGESWVNGRLVLGGSARVATFPPNVAYDDEIRAAEQLARELGKGIWDPGECPQ